MTSMARKLHRYLEVGNDGDFMSLPEPVYAPDGKPSTSEDYDALQKRVDRGEVVLPKIPPPPDFD